MTTQLKALSKRIFDEGFSTGKLEVIDQVCTANVVARDPAAGDQTGRDALKQMIRMYRAAFPDLRLTVDAQFAEGETVVTRWTARGTQKGELMGAPASNRKATAGGITIDRFANNQIQESWTQWDFAGLLQQLGLGNMPVAETGPGAPAGKHA